jgi:hypothetical protein
MDASTVSAAIAALSAAIAAFSAWNSRRSALASESALREASQQRQLDNSRQMLNALGGVYDDAMAMVESLARDLGRDPVKVTRCRDALRRSALVAGLAIPSVDRLIDATGPLRPDQIAQVQRDLQTRSASLHALADGLAAPAIPATDPPPFKRAEPAS